MKETSRYKFPSMSPRRRFGILDFLVALIFLIMIIPAAVNAIAAILDWLTR